MAIKLTVVVLVLCILACNVLGDMYLQNPRGCNDRLNEEGDRQNANRLFDSENNARGGYCWGPPMSFVEGSILPIQWTAQHGCGGTHVTCTEIIQYMCSDNKGLETDIIRDGQTITTIPEDPQASQQKQNGDFLYGMNENYQYYEDCKNRERNKGLFIADQNVGPRAIQTRQNPGGNRYGFECTEERDHYPYWHPAPWKDIAVMVPTLDNCEFYQKESQNVKDKNYCTLPAGTTNTLTPNNAAACATAKGTWMTEKSFGLPPPDCKLATFSRDNHLGNGGEAGAETANYTWVLPDSKVESCIATGTCNCVLRIRYNITTNESTGLKDEFLDARGNKKLYNDPTVNVEDGEYTLALNTAQFGRTFQDRSFMFHITSRPKGVSRDTKIYNLNVRGKRGNIVQTFPATEYDFTPNRFSVEEGDIVHFQWTGCDTNPGNNDGEGKVKTDRSNIVQIKDLDNNIPVAATNDTVEKLLFDNKFLRNRMALIDQTGCVPVAELIKQNGNNIEQLDTNCAKLNAAKTPYFDGGLVRMNQTGKFTYMSTRNNNFSNRTQKGQLTVTEKKKTVSTGAVVGIVIAVAVVVGGAIGGLVYYGKTHPHSAVGRAVDKIHMPHFKSSSSVSGARREGLLNSDHGAN